MIKDVVLNSLMTSELPEHYNARREISQTLNQIVLLLLSESLTSFDTAAMEEFSEL